MRPTRQESLDFWTRAYPSLCVDFGPFLDSCTVWSSNLLTDLLTVFARGVANLWHLWHNSDRRRVVVAPACRLRFLTDASLGRWPVNYPTELVRQDVIAQRLYSTSQVTPRALLEYWASLLWGVTGDPSHFKEQFCNPRHRSLSWKLESRFAGPPVGYKSTQRHHSGHRLSWSSSLLEKVSIMTE